MASSSHAEALLSHKEYLYTPKYLRGRRLAIILGLSVGLFYVARYYAFCIHTQPDPQSSSVGMARKTIGGEKIAIDLGGPAHQTLPCTS